MRTVPTLPHTSQALIRACHQLHALQNWMGLLNEMLACMIKLLHELNTSLHVHPLGCTHTAHCTPTHSHHVRFVRAGCGVTGPQEEFAGPPCAVRQCVVSLRQAVSGWCMEATMQIRGVSELAGSLRVTWVVQHVLREDDDDDDGKTDACILFDHVLASLTFFTLLS